MDISALDNFSVDENNSRRTRLAIIADDFTGALDTGIQFAKKGIRIAVLSVNVERIESIESSIEVIVFDTESRHMESEFAYRAVYEAVKACLAAGCTHIYKKTDSGLRGNIGAELQAAMDATGFRSLHFIPALPKIGRTTVDGVHLIQGIPVAQSLFANDPINPVRHSLVSEIIAETSSAEVFMGHREIGISVYDAKSDEDLERIGNSLSAEELRLTAGNAGFAEYLSPLIGLESRRNDCTLEGRDLVIVSGSINRISLDQLDRAQREGYPRIVLQGENKVREDFFSSGAGDDIVLKALRSCHERRVSIIDGGDPKLDTLSYEYANSRGIDVAQLWVPIARNFGSLIKRIIELDDSVNILCIGGDSLIEALHALSIDSIVPVDEVLQGVVLNRIEYRGKAISLMTKSGGFGPEDLVPQLECIMEKLSKGE